MEECQEKEEDVLMKVDYIHFVFLHFSLFLSSSPPLFFLSPPPLYLSLSLAENSSENIYPQEDYSLSQPEKRIRTRPFASPSFSNHDDRLLEMQKMIQRLEEEVQDLRLFFLFSWLLISFRENVSKKDEDVALLSHENSQMNLHCEELSSNQSRLIEENRILKRAVGIQDNKQRDLLQEIQQMRSIMDQAADHIGNLERANAMLRQQLESQNYPESYLPNLPPDVY